MPSPFPGMNPFLEQEDVWQDFHQTYITAIREVLAEQVRPAYMVKLEEFLFIHELSDEERRFLGRADLGVTERTKTPVEASTSVMAAPFYGRFSPAVDIERHSYVEIRDRENRKLVTVIELLSPSNKRPGPDREQYLGKRRQLIVSDVNLVELDFLRGGPRLPLEDLPDCDYYVLVSRIDDRPKAGVWPIRLRSTLPTIGVPLRAPSADARLDLQQILHRVYDAAGYADYIYTGAPQPPLHPDDAAWAAPFVPLLRTGS